MIYNNDGAIQLRYDTLINWDNANPILKKGEVGVANDNGQRKVKVGDGITNWSNLPYIAGGSGDVTQINWGDVLEKPTTFTPSAHNHNDIYYSESEIDDKLNTKLETVKVNGTALSVVSKSVNIDLSGKQDNMTEVTNEEILAILNS